MKTIAFFFALLFSILTIFDFIIITVKAYKRIYSDCYDDIKRLLYAVFTTGLWTLFYCL